MTSFDLDQRTGQKCPVCGSEIVYNGNYFCENFTYPYVGTTGTCDWAMDEKDSDNLFRPCYAGLMENRDNRAGPNKRKKIGPGYVWRTHSARGLDALRRRVKEDLTSVGIEPGYSFTTGRDSAGRWLRFERTI